MKKGSSIIVSLLILSTGQVTACGEFLDWHLFPQIESISFFVDGDLFLQPNRKSSFYAAPESRDFLFSPSDGDGLMRPVTGGLQHEVNTTGKPSSLRILQLADSLSMKISEPYCAEGEERLRRITLNGEEVKLELDPCLSVTALEQHNDRLLFGSGYVGECGMEQKGGGIEIRKINGWALVGKIPANELPGDLVRAIAVNPVDKTIWIATERGLVQFDDALNKRWQGYFCEKFGTDKQRPEYRLSETTCHSDDFATLARLLDVRDTEKYHRRIAELSAEERQKLEFWHFFMGGSYEEYAHEMNFLVDYFIEAYLNGDEWTKKFALWNVCDFNDPAARTFMLMMDAKQEPDRKWDIWRDNCAIREEKGLWRNRNLPH